MKNIIKILFLILISFPTYSIAGIFSIDELAKYWGFYLDTVSVAKEDSIALMKADSLNGLSSEERFYSYPRVYHKANFADLPCVTFYHLWTNDDRTASEYRSKLIFYNRCNNTIYRYGGDIKAFNAVFGQYSKADTNISHIIKMLSFYLLTQYTIGQTRILKSSDDFNTYFDSLYSNETSAEYPSRWRVLSREKLVISKLIGPFSIEDSENCYRFDFYTYGGLGLTEHWIIRYLAGAFVLDKRELVKITKYN